MKAIWNNAVLAESNDIVTVEGNAYFPRSLLTKNISKKVIPKPYAFGKEEQVTCQ